MEMSVIQHRALEQSSRARWDTHKEFLTQTTVISNEKIVRDRSPLDRDPMSFTGRNSMIRWRNFARDPNTHREILFLKGQVT